MAFFIEEILALLGAVEGAGTAVQFAGWIFDHMRKVGLERKGAGIRGYLENLGNTAEPEVRQLVEDWARSRKPRLEPAQIEELVGILVNLTRKARLLSTQGDMRSSVLRSLPLIEQLISDIQPTRKKGEYVVPNQDWKLEHYLGMGSFGEVWMARNAGFPQPRAYKFFTKEGSLQWIQKEQASLYAVKLHLGDHPNLIRFEDVAIKNQSMPYLALEYAGGGSLEDWILEDADLRPALNKHEVISGLVDGLMTAHDHGIVHRDLKPANVVLTEGPHPVAKITDFGLGQVTAQIGVSSAATQALLVGTPMYLPPEAQSHHKGRDPAQDDVFALGVLWYQLIVERLERPPYDFGDTLRSHGADSRVIALITRCLACPENRFKNAGELRNALEFVEPPASAPPGCFHVQHLFREYHANRRVGAN